MTRRYITHCAGVPAPTSPISHAVLAGNMCWVSGQHSLDINGTYCPGTADEEASRCFELLFRIIDEAGFRREDIVFVDIAFADLSDLSAVNQVFERFFEVDRRPARTICQAERLPFGARVKVQAIACR